MSKCAEEEKLTMKLCSGEMEITEVIYIKSGYLVCILTVIDRYYSIHNDSIFL